MPLGRHEMPGPRCDRTMNMHTDSSSCQPRGTTSKDWQMKRTVCAKPAAAGSITPGMSCRVVSCRVALRYADNDRWESPTPCSV